MQAYFVTDIPSIFRYMRYSTYFRIHHTYFQDESVLEPLEDGLNALLNIEVSDALVAWIESLNLLMFLFFLHNGRNLSS